MLNLFSVNKLVDLKASMDGYDRCHDPKFWFDLTVLLLSIYQSFDFDEEKSATI